MNKSFISIKEIASEVYSHRLLTDIPFETIIRRTMELIKVLNAPNTFIDKEALLHISKWKTKLPCDYYDINQLVLFQEMHKFTSYNKKLLIDRSILIDKLKLESDPIEIKKLHLQIEALDKQLKESAHLYITKCAHNTKRIAIKPATSTFAPMHLPQEDLVYKIQGDYLYSSLEEGDVVLSYKAIPVDDEGLPLIIDHEPLKRAIVSYIKMRYYTDLFDEGNINANVLQNAQQEYYAYVAQASNTLKDINHEMAEVISRIMNNPYIDAYEWNNTYDDLNKHNAYKLH